MAENEHPADIKLPAPTAPTEIPKQILPICPKCSHDPLMPMVRQVTLPFFNGQSMSIGIFLVTFCCDCRQLLPGAEMTFLGISEPQKNIVTPAGVMPRRRQ